eukprot:258021-Rhodomonas_salina.1
MDGWKDGHRHTDGWKDGQRQRQTDRHRKTDTRVDRRMDGQTDRDTTQHNTTQHNKTQIQHNTNTTQHNKQQYQQQRQNKHKKLSVTSEHRLEGTRTNNGAHPGRDGTSGWVSLVMALVMLALVLSSA